LAPAANVVEVAPLHHRAQRQSGTLHEDVKLFVAEQKAKGFKDTTVSRRKTVDGDHGRIETRKYAMIDDPQCLMAQRLNERHDRPGLAGVAIVESTHELPGKTERETRFYITSLSLPAERVGRMIRDHWAVESAPQAHTRRRFAMN
jgi:hypothetical protein